MSNIPADLKYANSHEWVRLDSNNIVTIGISDYAQEKLGDVVFVELPDDGAEILAGDSVAVVESVKAASDIYTPVTGTVVEVNSALEDAPEQINTDSYEDGWLFKVKISDPEELLDLMDADSYADQCAEE
ncbi:MAG: glycine cleavage system protein GcvH [Reinekea forsetii]|jgi:glycine cleavage system H protein|uniref:Glycine cleavage system H protein n=1 Tax=Reinekea forsetii TaxID=1336806 RepID=A0A2K8KT37_9GAMM|nr:MULTISPECIES: glycine cleavage system protein GcvH [Reinekea]ATX77239.1 glycine cleavage system H protein [Reinekea forsetii]MDB9895140.1 glycine cleavage system protein GcvH [Reinekea forsetii]MDO7640842.1 glycine cleavage system protein GcvH [Reinekea forsetii]MDO7646055.1 glycine cleavage system protein GcvH [Reinekea forsetii]MDO7674692.1 glycine cleavage system protein GcvH [Reinekea forsetii]